MEQKSVLFLTLGATFVLGGIVGFGTSALIIQLGNAPSEQSMFGEQPQENGTPTEPLKSEEKLVNENVLPLPLDLLINPLFYDWLGSVEGNVVEKTATTFTIEKDGHRLTIAVIEPTQMYDVSDPARAKLITFADIQLNSFVRSTVWLPQKGKLPPNGIPDSIVAQHVGIHSK